MKAVVKCNKCGEYADVDTSKVLTSLPPRYNAHCNHCGYDFYCFTDEVVHIQASDKSTDFVGGQNCDKSVNLPINNKLVVRRNYDKVINSLYRALYTEEPLTDDELKLIIDYVMEEYK